MTKASLAFFSSRIENQKGAEIRPFYDNIIFAQSNLLKFLLPTFLFKEKYGACFSFPKKSRSVAEGGADGGCKLRVFGNNEIHAEG